MNQLEEFGLAVKAEPIEGERSNEQECPKGMGGWDSPPGQIRGAPGVKGVKNPP